MKKTLLVLAIFALAPIVASSAAEAGYRGHGHGGFSIGASFSLAGLDFDIGYGGYGSHWRPYAEAHYYRTSKPFHYRGYSCHGGCYERAGYNYHHAACPAVAYHFRRHHFDPYVSFSSFFGPRYYSPYRYGYGHGYYGKSYRYRDRGRYYGHSSRYDRHKKSYRDRGRSGRYDRERHYDRGRRYDRGRHYDRGRAQSTRPPKASHDSRHRSDRGEYRERDRHRERQGERDRGRARRTRPRD